ncbi:MAG: ATP-binding protein [Candidatus Kapabacteria bacterium]|jgi:hypothetical protein|nr:ATP-binding protein [Candidatus Kapabacteria bacterium]
MIHRNLQSLIETALEDTPAIFLRGARQTGKSTLLKTIIAEGHPARYFSFDDLTTLHAARSDPQGFVTGLPHYVALDEVQRVPEILLPIKAAIDNDRANAHGRFLLTGSANILHLPTVADSLAGRMEVMTLYGLSASEIAPRSRTMPWLEAAFSANITALMPAEPLVDDISLEERLCRGGFPEVFDRKTASRRSAWFDSYMTTMLERDARDLTRIDAVQHLQQVVSLAAARTASIVNFSEISRSLQLPLTSLKRYMNIVEMLYFTTELPAWSANFSKRLVKSPKLHITDTGLAAYLLGANPARLRADRKLFGQILETFVVMELKKHCSWFDEPLRMFHLHAQNGLEIDILLENMRGELVAIEVKSGATVSANDAKPLKTFASLQNAKLQAGIMLYTGDSIVPLGENVWAVPISSLL